MLAARLSQRAGAEGFAGLAELYLKLAQVHPDCRRAVGRAVLSIVPDVAENKALIEAARKAAS